MNTRGKDLKVGDTIAIWYAGGRGTITELAPYTGPLTCWPEGARVASFAQTNLGMTIPNDAVETVIA